MSRVKRVRRPAKTAQAWQVDIGDHTIDLAWSPAGDLLAAAAVSGAIKLIEVDSGKVVHHLPGHALGATGLHMHPDGTQLASAGQDGKIYVWNVSTGQADMCLEGGAAWVEHVAWSPDGQYLASAAGRKLRLWDRQGRLLHDYGPHSSTIADIQWQPHGTLLSSAAYGGIQFWHPEQVEALRKFNWVGSILALAWSHDGRYIATGDQDSTIHFWIVEQAEELQMWGYETKVRELSWSADSRYLATGGSASIVIWDCKTSPAGTTPQILDGHENFITALAYQHQGAWLASGGGDGRLFIWNPTENRRPLAMSVFDEPISQIRWTPDDQKLAIGTEAGIVTVIQAG